MVTSTFERFYGADLWTFSSRPAPATPASRSGVGNFTNYGVRTIVATPDALYLGTANPMNLLTDPSDSVPEGGWELIRLERRSAYPVTTSSWRGGGRGARCRDPLRLGKDSLCSRRSHQHGEARSHRCPQQ
jgi:hypothetical protein